MNLIIKNKLALLFILPLIGFSIISCEKDDDDPIIETRIVEKDAPRYAATINFEEKVNGQKLELNTVGMPYTNKKGQSFKVETLRYLISDITFHKSDGSSFTINDYHLIDKSKSASFIFKPETKVPAGEYDYITFTFGFDRHDNQSGLYPDLNISNWGWPQNLGGGYHSMQLEGKYDSLGTDKGFATHMGSICKNDIHTPTTFEDNSFTARMDTSFITIGGDFSFSIVMNVEQWYEDPYIWDFNMYNLGVMMNYDAQRKLFINGPSVFSIDKK